jgi:uncharacterized protein YyaL (SSP411 family)
MYKTIFSIITLALLTFSFKAGPHGDGIKFDRREWKDVTKVAKKQNKPIFAMVCASWCSNCARMRAEVFTNPEVGEFFNSKFVSTMIDSEDFKNNIRATNWGVKAVPTMVFLTPNKKVIYMATGYKDVNKMMAEAQKALEEMGDK